MQHYRSLLLWIMILGFLIGSCNALIFDWMIRKSKEYWTSSVVSTINLDGSCYVKVHEEIVMGFKGDFGRIERAICESNLPFERGWFDIDDLVVTSNYSSVKRTELKESGKDCYSIHSYLKERTPSDKTTFVKLTLSYSMKGPLAIFPNADPEGMKTFEFGWNMKFKKGNIQKATFRVEYPSELYSINDMHSKDIGNGLQRIEKHFTEINKKVDMQLNLKGNVKSPEIGICRQPPYPWLKILLGIAFLATIVHLCSKYSTTKFKVDSYDTYEYSRYDYRNSYTDSYSDSGGCDAD